MKRFVTVIVGATLALGMMAGPALADHPHQVNNAGGCHDVPVGHQDHDDEDHPGKKFHGAAHKGPATEEDEGEFFLGKGNSPVSVAGGTCE